MDDLTYLPPIGVFLRGLRISRERLDGPGRIAVPARVLRALLSAAAAGGTFSAEFYRAAYPDLPRADDAGLCRHFAEQGYFEGRLAAAPAVDAPFYLETYPDVAAAVLAGRVPSAGEHYLRNGAGEGRIPNPALRARVERWAELLREPTPP